MDSPCGASPRPLTAGSWPGGSAASTFYAPVRHLTPGLGTCRLLCGRLAALAGTAGPRCTALQRLSRLPDLHDT